MYKISISNHTYLKSFCEDQVWKRVKHLELALAHGKFSENDNSLFLYILGMVITEKLISLGDGLF